MACSNCNTPSCGCSGTYVVSQTCPPACSEVFNSSCIVYTGVDISCLNDVTGISQTVISRNDYLDSALTKIVNFFCGRVNEALTSTIVNNYKCSLSFCNTICKWCCNYIYCRLRCIIFTYSFSCYRWS